MKEIFQLFNIGANLPPLNDMTPIFPCSQKKLFFFISLCLFLIRCEQNTTNHIIVTEVVQVEGTPIIVTRVVQHTIEIPVTIAPQNIVLEEIPPTVILDLGLEDNFPNLDPLSAESKIAIDLVENLFAGLTNYNSQQNRIEPELASHWDISNDQLTWTFYLRSDVFWVRMEQGVLRSIRPVNAYDVVMTFRRACDPRAPAPAVFILFIVEGCETVNHISITNDNDLNIIGVTALDDQTVQISLRKPSNQFLTITSLWWLHPVPSDRLKEYGDQWGKPENIVTSGAFLLTSASVASSHTQLQKNPLWNFPFSGNVQAVNILHVDEKTALELWKNKELDLIFVSGPLENEIPVSNYQLIPSQQVFYLAYNFDSPVLQHTQIRRAFGAAIDRNRLVDEIYGGQGLPLRHFAPDGVIGAPPRDEVGIGYNPDYAKQQMALSPYGDCRLIPPIHYLVSSSDLSLQQAELIRQMWMETLNCPEEKFIIDQVQFGTLLASTRANINNNRPDMWSLGWASYYPDEHNWVGDILHCNGVENRSQRSCSQVDDLITAAATQIPFEERWQVYRTVERIFFAHDGIEPISPLFVRANYRLTQHWLNYSPALFGGEQYDTYSVDMIQKNLEQID